MTSDRAIEDQSFGPCKHGDGCVEVVHARAVMASKRSAQRERDIWRRQAEHLRELLTEARQFVSIADAKGHTLAKIDKELFG